MAVADKVFAMLATFDDPALRAAAAKHFALPDLPVMMELVFSPRLTLEQHITIAGFGRDHARFRLGLAAALHAYGLHLYSNYKPTADWMLSGLEHYGLGHGCQLLFFLIHHPEDDLVLADMIEQGWLPDGVSTGGYDAYGNSAHYYYRAASLHVALNAPDRFDAWLDRPWIKTTLTMAVDRQTFKLLDAVRKRGSKKPAKPRAK